MELTRPGRGAPAKYDEARVWIVPLSGSPAPFAPAYNRMLTAQAAALNSLFLELTKRSGTNMGAHMGVMETYMRLALKAQSQCRATLEALVAIKNPPVVYARQANFAAGHQQVNNGALAHAGTTERQPNKLLEAEHGERLDPGATGKAGGSNQALETVGAIDGATHG
jgi:hypothetical protein